MSIRPRTLIVFFLVLAMMFALIKYVSVYWVIVFFNVILVFINSVFLFAYLEFRARKKPVVQKWPTVSVVIPNYNGGQTLAKCIESVKAMEYPLKKEIIVVDDGSKDDSRKILSRLRGIRVVLQPKNMGKAAALNKGISIAKGEVIAAIDSDTYPSKDCLVKMVPHFSSEKVGAVTGLVRAANLSGFIERVQELEYLVAFGFFQSVLSEINGVFVTPGPMSLFRAKVIRKIGGFDEANITEDMEIALRLQRNHYMIVACPEAQIFTEVPSTPKQLYRQRVRWYRGKFVNTRKYSDLLFNPDYGEFGMFSFPFSLIVEAIAILLLVVTVAANIENALNYFGFFASWLSISRDFFGLLPSISGINSSVYFYAITILMYSALLYMSHKFVNESINIWKLPQIAFFLVIYGLFISFVYFVSFFKEVNSSSYVWGTR